MARPRSLSFALPSVAHQRIRKAVIPAAGLGTRLLPATKAIPKEMLPVVAKPAIQLVVEECVASGIEMVVLVTGRYKGAIEDHFDVSYEVQDILHSKGKEELLERISGLSDLIDVVSIRQNRPLGLGHAVLTSRPIVGDEPFAVLLPDDVLDGPRAATRQLMDVWDETGCGAVSVEEVAYEDLSSYGIVHGEEVGPGRWRLDGMVEKPNPAEAPSRLGVVGRYVLPGEIYDYLASTPPGRGGEIQLTDGMVRLMADHGLFAQVLKGTRYDLGDAAGLIIANLCYAMKQPGIANRLKPVMRRLLSECS